MQVSENLETERKGERFTMIEPPLPPEKPVSPNRLLILIAGLILSLGAGFVAVVAKDSVDPSIRGVDEIRQLLSVPPLAVIPAIVTRAEIRRRRRFKGFAWTGAVATFLIAICLVHFFVRPLDVLWATLMRRFGA